MHGSANVNEGQAGFKTVMSHLMSGLGAKLKYSAREVGGLNC